MVYNCVNNGLIYVSSFCTNTRYDGHSKATNIDNHFRPASSSLFFVPHLKKIYLSIRLQNSVKKHQLRHHRTRSKIKDIILIIIEFSFTGPVMQSVLPFTVEFSAHSLQHLTHSDGRMKSMAQTNPSFWNNEHLMTVD